MSDSAVLTTAMSSMSIAVARQTTASVQRLDEGDGESIGRSSPPCVVAHRPRGRSAVLLWGYPPSRFPSGLLDAAAAGGRDHAALRRLDEHPALALEGELQRLARAAPDEVLHLEVGLERDGHAGRPGDGGLGVGERRRGGDVEQDGRAVGEDRHPARAGEDRVEEAAGHHRAAAALDLLDVPVDAGVEGEQVAAVDGDRLALEVDEVDVHRRVGDEDLARPGDLHQLRALAGEGLLDQPAHAARAGVLEGHVALVGDHRAELGLHGDGGQLDLEQLVVLEREGLAGLDFVERPEGGLHGRPDALRSRAEVPSRRRAARARPARSRCGRRRRARPARGSACGRRRRGDVGDHGGRRGGRAPPGCGPGRA